MKKTIIICGFLLFSISIIISCSDDYDPNKHSYDLEEWQPDEIFTVVQNIELTNPRLGMFEVIIQRESDDIKFLIISHHRIPPGTNIQVYRISYGHYYKDYHQSVLVLETQ